MPKKENTLGGHSGEVFPNAALCTTRFYGHVWFLSNLRGHGNAADESQRMKYVFMVRPLPWLGFIMLMYLTWLYVDLISLLKFSDFLTNTSLPLNFYISDNV